MYLCLRGHSILEVLAVVVIGRSTRMYGVPLIVGYFYAPESTVLHDSVVRGFTQQAPCLWTSSPLCILYIVVKLICLTREKISW